MGELKDKAKGLGNEVAGNIKQAAGRATNDPQLEGEGIAQERKGEGQNLKGKVKGAFGDKV
ncbi:CsbD family protein [Sphingorhabdus sp.]|uniref:CsbD family protein n=1 Tax=Sphingorhabdus sp. TaxID=1902408 RepID=UPI003593A7F9